MFAESPSLFQVHSIAVGVFSTVDKRKYKPIETAIVIAILVVLDGMYAGIGVFHEVNLLYAYLAQNPDALTNDYVCSHLRGFLPWTFKYWGAWFNIPLFHLYFGLLIKFALFYSYYTLVRRSLKDENIALLSLVLMLAFCKFGWHEFRGPIYLSNRQIALFLSLVGLIFYFSDSYPVAGLFLGLGAQFQSLNTLHLTFVCFLALLFRRLFQRGEPTIVWRDVFLFPAIFLILLGLGLSGQERGIEVEGELVDAITWWKNSYLIEADDTSVLHFLRLERLWHAVGLLVLATGIYGYFSTRNSSKLNPNWILIPWCSWLIIAIAMAMENFIDYLPAPLVEVFVPIQVRRQLSLHSFFVMPVFACAIWEVMLTIGKKIHPQWTQRVLGKKWVVWGAVILVCILKVGWERDPLRFIDRVASLHTSSPQDTRFFEKSPGILRSGDEMGLSRDSYYEVLDWIRAHTDEKDSFFTPPYLLKFRVYSRRASFFTEYLGGLSLFSQSLATLHYRRVKDLFNGENDADSLLRRINDVYALRELYLQIPTERFVWLKEKYPDIDYVLTEKKHPLKFDKVYENNQFVIYKIGKKLT